MSIDKDVGGNRVDTPAPAILALEKQLSTRTFDAQRLVSATLFETDAKRDAILASFAENCMRELANRSIDAGAIDPIATGSALLDAIANSAGGGPGDHFAAHLGIDSRIPQVVSWAFLDTIEHVCTFARSPIIASAWAHLVGRLLVARTADIPADARPG